MIDICNYGLTAAAAEEQFKFVRLGSLLFLLND
jgi:hypothetical protein